MKSGTELWSVAVAMSSALTHSIFKNNDNGHFLCVASRKVRDVTPDTSVDPSARITLVASGVVVLDGEEKHVTLHRDDGIVVGSKFFWVLS